MEKYLIYDKNKDIVNKHGIERFDLRSYSCVWDEINARWCVNNPHQHPVIRAWDINTPGFVFNGIAFETIIDSCVTIVTGCNEKNFKKVVFMPKAEYEKMINEMNDDELFAENIRVVKDTTKPEVHSMNGCSAFEKCKIIVDRWVTLGKKENYIRAYNEAIGPRE